MENISSSARYGAKQFIVRYGLGFLINFTGTVVIAREGGPELWGVFAISQLVLIIFAFLSLGGWGYLIQRQEEPSKEDIGNCYSFQTLLSIFWAGAVMVVAPFLSFRLSSPELLPLLFGTVIGGIPYGWRYIVSALSERNLRYQIAMVAELSDIIVFNAVAISLSLLGYTFYGILIGNALRGIVSTTMVYIKTGQKIAFYYDRIRIKQISKFSLPFISYNTLQWLPVNAGPVVAGNFIGVRELGILQLSYRTVEYARVLVTIASRLSLSVFARIGKSAHENEEGLKKALDLLFFLLVPGISIICALSPVWVPFVYGDAWARTIKIMIIIVFPFLAMAMMTLLSSLLSAHGKVRAPFLFFSAYNVVYWSILIILTKKVGFFGLPITEWVTLISCAVLLWEVKRVGFSLRIIFSNLNKLFITGLVTALIWYLALKQFVLEAIIFCLIFSILWFAHSPVKKEIKIWIKGHAPDVEH